MRAYSLVGALAAMMILMVVLIPLIGLQGRAFEQSHNRLIFPITRAIETDLANLEKSAITRSGRILGEGFFIHRRIVRQTEYLFLVTYEVFEDDGKPVFTGERLLYRAN